MKYLYNTYIRDYRRRFVKCYTNKVLHFDTTMTSRGEKAHAVLKKQLETSIENLKTMMNDINLMLINEQHNHATDLADARMRYSTELRKSIF